MPESKIEYLGEHRAAIPEIVHWLRAQWGHSMPEVFPTKLAKIFENRLICHQIPETFVALRDGEIIGTASLVEHDMSTRMALSPWLASVYIKAEHRGQGFGSLLVQALMDEAKNLGLERFFLFIPRSSLILCPFGVASDRRNGIPR